jgi:branched-chain amino acid transport system permease protein
MNSGRSGLRWLGWIVLIACVLVLPSLLKVSTYVFHTINMVAYYTIAVVGLNILMGYTGQISIGHAAFYGIGAYTSAILSMKLGYPFWALMLLAGLMASVVGMLVGAACLRLKEIYLAMATIGLAGVVEGIIINWDALTGGSMGLLGIPYFKIGSMKLNTPDKQFFLVIPVTIILLVAAKSLVASRVGRGLMAIREDPVAASCCGINATAYKLMAFTISAFYGGVAGSLFAHSTGILFPNHFGFDVSVLLLMMLVLGGRGTIVGSIVGAALMTIGFEMLRSLKEYQMILYGLMLIASILFLPHGIVGSLVEKRRTILDLLSLGAKAP